MRRERFDCYLYEAWGAPFHLFFFGGKSGSYLDGHPVWRVEVRGDGGRVDEWSLA